MGSIAKIIKIIILIGLLLFSIYTGQLIVFLLTLLFAAYFYSKNKKSVQTEAERIEKSISENGFFKHHENEIIQNYGFETFLNKTQEEVEVTVNEYVDLFELNFNRSDITYLAREINETVNGRKGD